MRLFIAVPVSAEVRARASEIISALRGSGADFKWVEPDNLHLTLRFLGETAPDKIPAIENAAAQAAAGRRPFELEFSELGAFPDLAHPRVLWLGVRGGAEPLEGLAADLAAALGAIGIPPDERPFQAHLTLGRLRGPRSLQELQDRIERLPPPRGLASTADRLVLFESRLTARGPSYRALRECKFLFKR